MSLSRRWNLVRLLLVFLSLAWPALASAQIARDTIFSPQFAEVRRASVTWDQRQGPTRQVIDTVCLVPDLATFLDVIATWDARHFFPVLIDDAEYNLKFLHDFRPSHVIRYPGRSQPLAAETVWERAIESIGKSWRDPEKADLKIGRGDEVPQGLGPVPPGVVVSTPESPTLAAAVALAAGHFQPLWKWETPKNSSDILTLDEARSLALNLETRIASAFPHYDRLGDDCDFVTLAGDYPYRYNDNGTNCFDDLILRPSRDPRRWAFAGRLSGDLPRGVYQAMCSLFVHPTSALLFNGYAQKDRPWTDYAMEGAETRLSPVLKTTLRNGERATLTGWHQAFDPTNTHGLLLINTSGNPSTFNVEGGGPGQSADVPETVPTTVLIIHSYSAESFDDPQTIAGRWQANGAYAYFGSMNEPYLHAFRTPSLVASFLAENLPVVTAVRRTAPEVFAQPWRLIYLGDPLYRLRASGNAPGRLTTWEPLHDWPAYSEFLQPGDDQPEALRLTWVLRMAIFLTQTAVPPQQKVNLANVLLGIDRDRLEPAFKPIYDALVVETLLRSKRSTELIERLTRILPAERSPSVHRHLETAQAAALQRAIVAKNARQAMSLWTDVIRSTGSRDFVSVFTQRVGHLADETPSRLSDWRDRLRGALHANPEPTNLPLIQAELNRVVDRLAASNSR